MSFKVKKFSDMKDSEKEKSSVIVVYGEPDSGKSTFLLTATKDYKTMYFDIEGMIDQKYLSKIPAENINLDNLHLASGLDNLDDVNRLLDSDECLDFDLIVIDSISYLVGLMTANANPAELKGNSVFAYYRDLGRNALFIIDKARKKGINIAFAFQATKDQKGYEGTFIPKVDGKEIPDRLRELSNLMVFIQKNGKGKRTIWQDTNDTFCHTKSKLLPAEHDEKVEFEGIKEFTLQNLLGGEKLLMIDRKKKISPEQVKELDKLIKESNKIEPINEERMFQVCKIKHKPLKDLTEYEFETLKEIVQKRTQDKLAEKQNAK